jgi:hypothetical protein
MNLSITSESMHCNFLSDNPDLLMHAPLPLIESICHVCMVDCLSSLHSALQQRKYWEEKKSIECVICRESKEMLTYTPFTDCASL